MIKKINSVENIGRFEMLMSSRGCDGEFEKFNVLYADNGAGKSTLCDVFRTIGARDVRYVQGRKRVGSQAGLKVSIKLDNGHDTGYVNRTWTNRADCPPVFVYDDRFVRENVFVDRQIEVDQKRNLYGLVLGSKAITLQNAIAVADTTLANAKGTFDRAESTLKLLVPNGYEIESFRNLAAVEDVDAKILAATRELETRKSLRQKSLSLQKQALVAKFTVPQFPDSLKGVLATTLDDVALAAETKVKEHLAAHTRNLSGLWVKQGFEGQLDSHCPYCGCDMEGTEILAAYKSFFSGKLKALEKARQELVQGIEESLGEKSQAQLRRVAEKMAADQKWWHDMFSVDLAMPCMDVDRKIVDCQRISSLILAALARKSENLANGISLTVEEEKALCDLRVIIDEINEANKKVDAVNVAIAEYKAKAATVDVVTAQGTVNALDAAKKRYLPNVVQAFKNYDSALTAKNQAQAAKTQANANLKAQSEQVLNDYGDRINQILQDFGVPFQIKSEGVNFRGGLPSGQLVIELMNEKIDCSSTAASDPEKRSLGNTLSGGDRSALALAYFLAQVEKDPRLSDAIVVFDDPYHDQDRDRRSYTVIHVHNVARTCNQCFVFSHNLEFAREVEKLKGNTGKKAAFKIERFQDPCVLSKRDLPPLPSKRYKSDYAELVEFSRRPTSDVNQLRNVAGLIRIVLEGYLRHKFPSAWDDNAWLSTMVESIRNSQTGDPLHEMTQFLTELSALVSFSAPYHHAPVGTVIDIPTPAELKTHVDATLRVMHHG